jgi:hypothetical protein
MLRAAGKLTATVSRDINKNNKYNNDDNDDEDKNTNNVPP